MSRQANPTLIGIFVLGALILAIIATLLLAGGNWFQMSRQYVMYFEGAAQGLQTGAPVVFLGVKIGNVEQIQLGFDKENQRFMVPVTVEIEPHVVKTGSGEQIDLQDRTTISRLIDQGMRARLRMQNLLTGQLYIDLDFYPDKPAQFFSDNPVANEIPTIPTTLKELAALLEDFPITEFLADLAAIGSSTKRIITSGAMSNIPHQLEATLSHLESLTARLDAESGPLLREVKDELVELHQAVESVQSAMGKVGNAADRVEEWAAPDSQVYRSITNAGSELAGIAQTLQQLADEESPAVQRFNTALREISRAARAIRLLAESLERQPEAVIRGKRDGGER